MLRSSQQDIYRVIFPQFMSVVDYGLRLAISDGLPVPFLAAPNSVYVAPIRCLKVNYPAFCFCHVNSLMHRKAPAKSVLDLAGAFVFCAIMQRTLFVLKKPSPAGSPDMPGQLVHPIVGAMQENHPSISVRRNNTLLLTFLSGQEINRDNLPVPNQSPWPSLDRWLH